MYIKLDITGKIETHIRLITCNTYLCIVLQNLYTSKVLKIGKAT